MKHLNCGFCRKASIIDEKGLSIIFGIFKKPVWLIIIFILLSVDLSWGQSQKRDFDFELGVSYDDEYVANFSSEQAARDELIAMTERVNNMFLEVLIPYNIRITLHPRMLRKIAGNFKNEAGEEDPDRGEFVRRVVNNWLFKREGEQLCFIPDLIHHVSGRSSAILSPGHTSSGGLCNNFPTSGVYGASYSRYEDGLPHGNSFRMAHEILHQFLGDHEICDFSNGETPLFCESVTGNTFYEFEESDPYDEIELGPALRAEILTTLNRAEKSCVLLENWQVLTFPPECHSCENRVSYSAPTTEYDTYFEFNCVEVPSEEMLTHNLQTVFLNSCHDRIVNVDIQYNHNHVTSIDLPPTYSQPFEINTGDYTRKTTSPQYNLTKGATHIEDYDIRFNGTGIYDINRGVYYTPVKIWYNFVTNPPFEGSRHGIYWFHFPYKIDKRGQSVVYATEITTPVQSDLHNFSSGIRHDIYIDGELIFDYNANFINAHFFLGENAKITIPEGKSIIFENCTFNTCDSEIKWEGIELAYNSYIDLKGNSIIYNARTAIKALSSGNIKIEGSNNTNGRIIVKNCTIGIEAKNGGTLDIQNCLFTNNSTAIDLYNNSSNIESTEFNAYGGYGIRVDNSSVGFLRVLKNCKFENLLRGISVRNTNIYVSNTVFENNYLAIVIYDSPNLSHEIKENVFFRNTKVGAVTVSNSTSQNSIQSKLLNSRFIGGLQYGLRLSNTKGTWKVDHNEFTNNRTGIKLLNSNDNEFTSNNFNFSLSDREFATTMNFIEMSSSDNNLIGKNNSTTNNFIVSPTVQPADIYRHIFLNNSGFRNEILCNNFTGGSRGINPFMQSMTIIAGNEFNNVYRGLYYGLMPGDRVTTTGLQDFKNNKWYLANPTSDIGATHLGLTELNVNRSQYKVHTDDPSDLPLFESAASDWFVLPTVVGSPFSCNTGFVPNLGEDLFQTMTIGNGFNDFLFGAGMNLYAQDHIYDAIISGLDFGASSGVIKSYLDTLESNLDLYHVKEAEKLMYFTSTAQQGIEVRFGALKDAIDEYNLMDSISSNTRDSMLQVISYLATAAQTLYNTYKFELDTNLMRALVHLAMVSSNEAYWYNKAKTLEVLIKKWQGIHPDSSTMTTLQSIANLCPLAGGKGVYIARGILSEYLLEDIIYDDLGKCDTILPRTTSSTGYSFTLYPNPANGEFVIESTVQIENIRILDIKGSLMYQSSANDKKVKVSAQNLSEGLYIVEVKFINDPISVSKKLVITP